MSPTRQTWILAALIVAIVFLSALTPFWRKAQGLGATLLQPLAGATTESLSYLNNLIQVNSIARQNSDLLKEVVSLSVEKSDVAALEQANRELRLLAKVPTPPKFNKLGAEIIGRRSDETGVRYYINRGSRDGIGPGMAVVAAFEESTSNNRAPYFIGIVSDVAEVRSAVTLTTSPLTKFAVEVAAGERTTALATGEYNLAIRLELLPATAIVPIGAPVVTSNLGGVIPADLAVGSISSIQQPVGDFFKTATVAPIAAPENFRFVAVLLPTETF